MEVKMNGDTLCVQVPVESLMMAFFYRRVGSEWVKYKRQRVSTLH